MSEYTSYVWCLIHCEPEKKFKGVQSREVGVIVNAPPSFFIKSNFETYQCFFPHLDMFHPLTRYLGTPQNGLFSFYWIPSTQLDAPFTKLKYGFPILWIRKTVNLYAGSLSPSICIYILLSITFNVPLNLNSFPAMHLSCHASIFSHKKNKQ